MVLITANKCQRLLCFSYVARVSPPELAKANAELKLLLQDLPAGLRLLADLSLVEYMDPDCVSEMGRAMDLIDQHGVSLIVRVIPDASKDIGLSILTVFHYPHQPRIITCQDMVSALKKLSL